MFEKAQWIWVEETCQPDTYGEFYEEFDWKGGRTVCRLSSDGDYTLFINGRYVASNQYGDYEWYKSYDCVEITPYLREGKNAIAVLVWHFGTDTQRYIKAQAGLLFEIEEGGQVCVESGKHTLCRYSRAYQNGLKKIITNQLGYSYLYDATREDAWKKGELQGFAPSAIVDKHCALIPRPIEKAVLLAPKCGKVVKQQDNQRFIVDLGAETVGLLSISLHSASKQKIIISYGEHLEDGQVRRLIGGRDFSVTYIAKEGLNEYTNYMLRFGGRYLQVESEEAIDLHFATLLPQIYPTKEKAFVAKDEETKAIYQLCLNSLQLCMMEHYVDCPWREQCLYAFDSRNQMLSGYYAYEDGNAAYARANLKLMSQDRHFGGLMAICYPCGTNMTIPSFSLHYTLSVKEYLEHTGDIALAKEVFPRICEYLDAILARRKDGLICRFEGKENWNFYDWSEYSNGAFTGESASVPDAQINILTVMALRCLERICELADIQYPYENIADELAQTIYEKFYNREQGAFSVTVGGGEYVEFVNAIAVLFEIVKGDEATALCQRLAAGKFLSCSLSTKCFTYDALLKTDAKKYTPVILDAIYRDYRVMLRAGATATWETIEGASAFQNAGSLCHGWTAMPIYYFKKLKVVE